MLMPLGFLAVAGVALGVATRGASLGALSALGVVIASVLVAYPWLRRDHFDPFHPVCLASVQIGLYYGVRGLQALWEYGRREPMLNPRVLASLEETLPTAELVALCALAAFTFGCLGPVRPPVGLLPRLDESRPGAEWTRVGWWSIGAGSISLILTAQRLLTGATLVPESLVNVVGQLDTFAFAGLGVVVAGNRSGVHRKWVIAFVAVIALLFAVVGFRHQGLSLMAGCLAAFHYGWRPVRRRALLGVAAVGLFLIYPAVEAVRRVESVTQTSGSIDRAVEAVRYLSDYGIAKTNPAPRPEGILPYAREAVLAAGYRLHGGGVDALITIIPRTPSTYPYIWRERLSLLGSALIPRAVDPGKQDVNISSYFKSHYWGSEPGNVSNQKPGILGDWYMQGGLGMVIAAMFVLGVVAGTGRRWFDQNRQHPLAIGFYVIFVTTLLTFESDSILMWTSILERSALFYFLVLVVRHGARVRAARGTRTHFG